MTRTQRQDALLWPLLVVLGLLVAACGGDDGDDDAASPTDGDGQTPTTEEEALEPQDGGTLVFTVEADSDGYHPLDNRWSISGNFVGSAIYEPLMVERGDGKLDPWLAESVEPNDDATEWTITVKEGITFHDGTPLDADAVALNLQERQDHPLTSSAHRPMETVEVTGPDTVVVTMNTPWASFDHVLAAFSGYMISPSALGDGDRTQIIGTGPFVFEDWDEESQLTVARNEDYWRGPAHLDGIEFRFITDVGTRTTAIETGDVHAGITPDPAAIRAFREDDGFDVYAHSSEPFHVLLNRAVPPFDNRLAREALVLATDQEAMIAAMDGEGILEPVRTPFVPSNPWHLEDAGFPEPDQERARALVEQYEEETGEPLRFTLNGSVGNQEQAASALIEQWSAVGIEAEFGPVDQSVFINEVILSNYQAAIWRNHNWVDPDFNYIFWHSSNSAEPGEVSINFSHTESPELDAALEAGRATLDPDARRQAYDDVQRLLNQELTHVWLYGQVWALVSADTVHGWDELVDRGLSRLEPKVHWADVWMEQ